MQTVAPFSACTALHDLRISIHLGVGDEERAKPQDILVSVRCYSNQALGSYTDDEGGYICYGALSEVLRSYLTSQPFRLIEYIGLQCFERIRASIKEQIGESAAESIAVWVHIHKLTPPVESLEGGSSFTYTDLPETVILP